MPKLMTKQELANKVLSIPYESGKIFSVTFVKKNGELRKMVCRRGVKRHLRGGSLGYNARSFKLLPVFDMQKQDYRMINCESIQELRIDGDIYVSID